MPIKIHIRIADEYFGEVLSKFLKRCEFEIVSNVHEADFVVLSTDLTAPSAYATCQELRRQYPQLSIVILSNETTLGEDVKAQYAGASHVFAIPFAPEQLSDYIRGGEQHGEY